MAIKEEVIEKYLKEMSVEYKKNEDDVFLINHSSDKDEISIAVRLMDNGSYLQIKAAKHLGDLVAEVNEEVRANLLKWMLEKNYYSKLGCWEYDPKDHDYNIAVGHFIADGELTKIQFRSIYNLVSSSVNSIPEMKKSLGINTDGFYEKEKKRQELLEQLRELDEECGI